MDNEAKQLALDLEGCALPEGKDGTEIQDNRVRSVVCELMSEMLDNPDEHGIYPTSRFMWRTEQFILNAISDAQDEVAQEKNEQIAEWRQRYDSKAEDWNSAMSISVTRLCLLKECKNYIQSLLSHGTTGYAKDLFDRIDKS